MRMSLRACVYYTNAFLCSEFNVDLSPFAILSCVGDGRVAPFFAHRIRCYRGKYLKSKASENSVFFQSTTKTKLDSFQSTEGTDVFRSAEFTFLHHAVHAFRFGSYIRIGIRVPPAAAENSIGLNLCVRVWPAATIDTRHHVTMD